MRDLEFGKFKIGRDRDILVIAEIGVNHEGSFETCAEMVREAAKAGAHSVKLQTIDADENYVRGTESHDLFSKCALTNDETKRIFDLARELGVEPFTTAGDFKTLEFVESLDPCAHKISSGLLTSIPIVEKVSSYKRTVLASTGMASQENVDEVVGIFNNDKTPYGIFQCTSMYPVENSSLNLNYIRTLEEKYQTPIGFSDHSLGVEAAGYAVAAGAMYIEKHFSLDTKRASFDHGISLDPKGLKELCDHVKRVNEAMGSRTKSIDSSILEKRTKFNRCLVARQDIKMGEEFNWSNVSIKRPLPESRGLDPNQAKIVIGKKASRNICLDEPICSSDFQ